jgi:hypothetical protein
MFYAAKSVMNALPKLLLALTAAAALSFAHPAKANLITNPGFETGDFTGWTVVNATGVGGTFAGVAPHSGNFQAVFSGPGSANASLTQSVATTPGASYTIDFFLSSAAAIPFTESVSVSWGGVTLLSMTNLTSGYNEFTFTETASTASTALLFNFATFGGAWLLDDISVTPAGVPDGGSTASLLGCAFIGLAALRRKLGC